MPITYTPIRYPGGKSKLYPLIANIIQLNYSKKCTYVEPFAGGAGLALKLLMLEEVEKIVINDIDRAVYCMWNCIVNQSDSLIDFINTVDLNINEWNRQREIFRNSSEYSEDDLGFATFYLNRTNRSGILCGGIIGGKAQDGKYLMSARFNRENLISKIRAIGARRSKISIYNLDASIVLDEVVPTIDNSFVYLDPPYVSKGPELYMNYFTDSDHRELGDIIKKCTSKWMLTYDVCPLVEEIYSGYLYQEISIGYSAYSTSRSVEYMISSANTVLPSSSICNVL